MNTDTLIVDRIGRVVEMIGTPQSSIYEMVREGTFPKPIRLGPNRTGWLRHEVQAWLRQRVAERDISDQTTAKVAEDEMPPRRTKRPAQGRGRSSGSGNEHHSE